MWLSQPKLPLFFSRLLLNLIFWSKTRCTHLGEYLSPGSWLTSCCLLGCVLLGRWSWTSLCTIWDTSLRWLWLKNQSHPPLPRAVDVSVWLWQVTTCPQFFVYKPSTAVITHLLGSVWRQSSIRGLELDLDSRNYRRLIHQHRLRHLYFSSLCLWLHNPGSIDGLLIPHDLILSLCF